MNMTFHRKAPGLLEDQREGENERVTEGAIKEMRVQTQFHFVPALCQLIENELVSVQPADMPRHSAPPSSPPSLLCLYSVSFTSAGSGFHHGINLPILIHS